MGCIQPRRTRGVRGSVLSGGTLTWATIVIRVFFLTTIVGRVWVGLGLYTEVLELLSTQGPGRSPSRCKTRIGPCSAMWPRDGLSLKRRFLATSYRGAPIRPWDPGPDAAAASTCVS